MDDQTLLEKLFIHLAETRGQWELRAMRVFEDPDFHQGWLRRGALCPLHSLLGATSIRQCIDEHGISPAAASKIADAADERNQFDPELRAEMLRAAGIATPPSDRR